MKATTFLLVAAVTGTYSFSVAPVHNGRIARSMPSPTQRNAFESEAIATFMSEFTASQEAVVAAGAAALAGFAAAISGQSSSTTEAQKVATKKKVEEPKIDVSIPYDAAALLSYNQWKGDLSYDAKTFQTFKAIYEEKAVTEVCQKRAIRELNEAAQKADEKLAKLLKELSEQAKFSFSEKN